MLCCVNCFGDPFLNAYIPTNNTGIIGKCDYCDSCDVPLIIPSQLSNYFQIICSIYTEDITENARPLAAWFRDDWNIFQNMDSTKAQILLGDILNDAQFIQKKHLPIAYPTPVASEVWASFCEEIKWGNRFFVRPDFLERLKERFADLEKDASIFRNTLFRARVQEESSPLQLTDMKKPPEKKTKSGRANPAGISYLYTASTLDTAIAEVRPHPGDIVAAACFIISEPLRLLSLRSPRGAHSPFMEEDVLALRYEIEFLCHLGNELSKPVLPRDADFEYIPTQYLCEFIKSCGDDGVVFNSSVHDNGFNITLFDDIKITEGTISYYKVKSLKYDNEPYTQII
jgi:hypothetical protein